MRKPQLTIPGPDTDESLLKSFPETPYPAAATGRRCELPCSSLVHTDADRIQTMLHTSVPGIPSYCMFNQHV